MEAKEAGAAGIIGVIANVLRNGSPIMSSFAAALGLDAPVEVCIRLFLFTNPVRSPGT